MAPDLSLKKLQYELFEWLLYGANGECILQLYKAVEIQQDADVVLYVDMMLLVDYDPELAKKFMFDFNRIYFVLNDIIQAFLRSNVFSTMPDAAENPDIVIRFCNHPSPPRSLRFPPESRLKFVSYLGLVVECCEPEDIGKHSGETLFQTMRIQRLQIMSKVFEGSKLKSFSLLNRNQLYTLIVDREYVGVFYPGQLLYGVGEIGLAGLYDHHVPNFVKAFAKRGLSLSAFIIYANSAAVVPRNVNLDSDDRAASLRSRTFHRSQLTNRNVIEISRPSVERKLLSRVSMHQQALLDWKETLAILSDFGEASGQADLLKPKFLLLLSLVSEPSCSQIPIQNELSQKRWSVLGEKTGCINSSPCSFQTDFTWDVLHSGQHTVEDQLSIVFLSSDTRLSRLVNWAFQLFPVKSKLTLFPNSNVVDYIPQGSLILLQGNTLMKRTHINLLESLLKMSSPHNCRKRACIAWCIYPDDLRSTEEKQLRKLWSQNMFQYVISSHSAVECELEERMLEEADSLFAEVENDQITNNSVLLAALLSRIESARLISVSFSKSCRDVIKAWFLTSRMKADYSIRDLHLVIKLARAHSRLHLRSIVNTIDAVVGIMLVEEVRSEISESHQTVLGFPSARKDPMGLYYESGYEGVSKPEQFLKMFVHVLSVIRQYDSEFCVTDDLS